MTVEEQLRELAQDSNYTFEFSKTSESCWVYYTGHEFPVLHFDREEELRHFMLLLQDLKDKLTLTLDVVKDIENCMSMSISHWCYHRRDNVTDVVLEEVATDKYFVEYKLPLDIKKFILKHILDSITVRENTYIDNEGCVYNSCTLS